MTTYRYTVAELRGQLRQLLLSGAAIALGVAFLIASVSGSGALVDSFSQTAAAEVGPGDIQVTGTAAAGAPDAAAVERARGTAGVAAVAPRLTGTGAVLAADGRPLDRTAVVSAVAEDPALRWQLLRDGRWPAGPGEVLLDTDTAHRLDAAPGTEVQLARADGSASTARLVGTLDGRGAPSFAGRPVIGVPAGALAQYATGVTAARLDVRLGPDASRTGAVEALRAALGSGAEVHTREASVREATRQSGTLYGVVLIASLSFVLIALAVARMVVGNTFSVMLAQRTRQLALLRCVGADRQQLRRLIRRQGLLLGAGASAAGVLLGVLLCAVGTAVAGTLDLGPVHLSLLPAPLTCALAGLFGILLTLLAVRGPAKAAAAVPPVAALGGTPAPTGGAARVRAAVWISGLLLAGTTLLVTGALAPPPLSLLAVTLGAIASFFGVLRLADRVLPAVVGLLGRPARRLGGTAARLAAQQLRLNPGRTGATGAALLLGVTVMVGAVTALEVTSGSLVPAVSARQPGVFSAAAGSGGALPAGAIGSLAAERGLTVTPVRSATVDLDGRPTLVAAADPARLNPSTDDLDRARTLADGAALSGLGESGSRRVGGSGGSGSSAGGIELRLEPGHSSLPFTLQSGATLLVTPATLDRLAPGAPVTTAWITPADGEDRPTARRALDRALADHPQVTVTDTAAQADTLRSLLDRLTTVSMALLSFSVAIAGLGVAATLMLSISERSREIGMLRAIGMSRRQLRRMLTLEAVLLSLAAALVGTALGIGYGWAAARSVTSTVGTVGGPPVLPVLAALALTVLTGLAAAVLPARRVGRMTAVAAMRAT
ncbi:putative ABC transport system permease protein [Streptomyces sp. 1114.5]|uniref:FtsX-like permease family protein n=1 Tax=Streptomyces sp. 1114.5 TaxID=1938830 RepID=UPI000EB40292|nr:FtsX-like permease family protein [Streptomyces sp. 1114.5]RKT16264.1 putative ABC transport system permease protein [Streptomyces sp. 1114.5]